MSVFIYSLGSIPSKFASKESLLSFGFVKHLFVLLLLLIIYSIIWQQVLKHASLSFAYINKATSIIWGLFFGNLFFNEKIGIFNIIGAVIVIIGISFVALGETDNE